MYFFIEFINHKSYQYAYFRHSYFSYISAYVSTNIDILFQNNLRIRQREITHCLRLRSATAMWMSVIRMYYLHGVRKIITKFYSALKTGRQEAPGSITCCAC